MLSPQVGGGGDQVSFKGLTSTDYGADQGLANLGGASQPNLVATDPSDQYLYNRAQQYQNANPQYGLLTPASDVTPIDTGGGGGVAAGAGTGGGGVPGSIPGGGVGGGTAQAAPVHHTYQEYLDNGQAYTDPTYVMQKAALLGKLGDYQRNVAGQVGSQNLSQVNDPNDKLLGSYYKGNALGNLFKENKDINGDSDFVSSGALAGGSLGKQYDTALANFNNQQNQGLRNTAEDFAARGMLGTGSGVWQTARNNLQDQYRNQLNNINDSTVGQYNSLLGNLADQYSQGRTTLNGYLTDASNRMATQMNSGLPSTV